MTDDLAKFWKGRVVKDVNTGILGHVVSFRLRDDGEYLIRIDFATGERYDLSVDHVQVV